MSKAALQGKKNWILKKAFLIGRASMQGLISILREVRDPRDFNARHNVGAILFLALAGTLCGAKSCVEIAEFVEGNEEELSTIVDLAHGPPSHDTFSRLFRLLDPAELAQAFTAFMTELRRALGLGAPHGVVAIDGKSLRRGYEKGCAFLPPLMVTVWDSETRLAIAQTRAEAAARWARRLRCCAAWFSRDVLSRPMRCTAIQLWPKRFSLPRRIMRLA